MTTPHIVFLDRATFAHDIVWRRPAYVHQWDEYASTDAKQTNARIGHAHVIITNKVRIDRVALDMAPYLRWILVAATGMDNIDLQACRERGVRVQNVMGYGTASVAEHVFAMMLALRRNLPAYQRSVLAGRWQESGQYCYHDFAIGELYGATLAIIGSGTIGSEVARLGSAFGMRVILAERKHQTPRAGRIAFNAALNAADIISLHCPLTADTRNLLAAREFALMQRRPLLINTARGGLIDTTSLIAAIQQGQIAGVGLDVATVEPLRADDPLQAIVNLPNVMITPHIAWASRTAQQRLADQLAAELDTFIMHMN
jgi:glycerate dehydrogenase